MSSNEDFSRNMWYVLKKIQTHCIQNNDNIIYEIDLMDSKDELQILQKLAEWNAIQIHRRQLKENFHVLITLAPLEPKFNNIYKGLKLFQEPSSGINPDVKQQLFSISFLKKEIQHFQSMLKHCAEAEMLSYKDFHVLMTVSHTLQTLLSQIDADKSSQSLLFEDAKIGPHTNNQSSHFSADSKYYQPSLFSKQQSIPVHITDEVVISGLKERLDALKPKSPEYSRPKFPHKIPAGTEWENIDIKFLDDERIAIYVKGLEHVTDYREMGMIGKGKVPKPSEQWNFLKVLAKCHGEISIKDPEAKDVYKKHKSGLSKTLRHYFSIDYDPFQPYHSTKEKNGNSYQIKITLIPPPEKEIALPLTTEEADPLGIREYLGEIAPHI